MLATYYRDLLTSNVNAVERSIIQGGNAYRLHTIGIPNEVKEENLEESLLGIFDKLGCNIEADLTKAYQFLGKANKAFIFAYTRRKDYQQVWNLKR